MISICRRRSPNASIAAAAGSGMLIANTEGSATKHPDFLRARQSQATGLGVAGTRK